MTLKRTRLALNAFVASVVIGLAACAGTPPSQVSAQAGNPGHPAKTCANAPPSYPPHARQVGAQGVVKLAVLVGADGSFLKGEIRKSSGSTELDNATIAAAAGWCWKPSTDNGVPVEKWQVFDYRWKLD